MGSEADCSIFGFADPHTWAKSAAPLKRGCDKHLNTIALPQGVREFGLLTFWLAFGIMV